MHIVFFCCTFSKERNQLITGKRKLEEQCESAKKNVLKQSAFQDALVLANGSIKDELTLTVKKY